MAILLGPDDEVTVEVATDDDINETIGRTLGELGLTLAELAEQAAEDEFTSERARNLWFQIAPIGGR